MGRVMEWVWHRRSDEVGVVMGTCFRGWAGLIRGTGHHRGLLHRFGWSTCGNGLINSRTSASGPAPDDAYLFIYLCEVQNRFHAY